MTVRSPLVLVGGKIEELPASDVILGAPTGPTGATGSTGQAGVSATISVGTVTTLAAGASATVTNSGTSSAAVFDFGIPQGAAGSSGSGDFVRITKTVTTGTATTITFSSIPGTYTDLEIRICGRDTGSVGALEAYLSLNGDTTAGNYATTSFSGASSGTYSGGTTAPTGGSGVKCILIPGSSTATSVGCATILINNYAGTVFQKLIQVLHVDSTGITRQSLALWKNTAAITSITIKAGNTAFVNGTTATLYGVG